MKKKYTKPLLFVETFELTEHIASNCNVSGRANHTEITSCGFDNGDPNGMIFLDGVAKCSYDPYAGEYSSNDDLQKDQFSCEYNVFMESYIMYSS